MDVVPSLYEQCDALFMPTLLEFFSGTYIEAMLYKKPILTSDRDFARDVCQDAADYIDPHDVDDIFGAMQEFERNSARRSALIKAGTLRLKEMPNWDSVAQSVLSTVDRAVVCDIKVDN